MGLLQNTDQAPWKTNENYKVHTKKIIFDGSGGKIQLVGDQSNLLVLIILSILLIWKRLNFWVSIQAA